MQNYVSVNTGFAQLKKIYSGVNLVNKPRDAR